MLRRVDRNWLTFQMCCVHHQGDRPDAGGSKHPWNVGKLLWVYKVQHPGRQWSSYSSPWEPEISHIILINHSWLSYHLIRHSSLFLFIFGLFNDAVSSSDCITLDDRVINYWRIGKNMEGSSRGRIWGTIPRYYPRFKLRTSRVRSSSGSYSAVTFSQCYRTLAVEISSSNNLIFIHEYLHVSVCNIDVREKGMLIF
jgi:hypothetical protein